jgi:hypothetical protein
MAIQFREMARESGRTEDRTGIERELRRGSLEV